MSPKNFCCWLDPTVGAGGYGDNGGGGSGYFDSLTVSLPSGFMKEIEVYVSSYYTSDSTVTINHKTCRGVSGKGGKGHSGGDGYSGGGGATYSGEDSYPGGSNGTNGFGYNGGHGTNATFISHQLFNFELSPGQGGKGSNYYKSGGGGGGYGSEMGNSGVVLMEVFN